MNRLLIRLACRLAIVSMLFLIAGCGHRVRPDRIQPQGVFAEADAAAREAGEALVRGGIPGVSIAVGARGRVVFAEGFGFADLESRTPVDYETRFRIASVSKPLTGVTLMTMVQDGTMSLDETAGRYLPELPERFHPITARQLAGHLGGIRHYKGDELLSNVAYPGLEAGLAMWTGDELLTPPGETQKYTSHGFNLLGVMMEKASDRSFDALVYTRVLDPLAMDDTVPERPAAFDQRVSRFYDKGPGGDLVPAPAVDNSYKWPSGGYLSTAEDLVLLGLSVTGPGLLDEQSLETMFTRQKKNDGTEVGYGIGWSLSGGTESREAIAWHSGSHVGGKSLLIVYRDTGVVVAILTNRRDIQLDYGTGEAIATAYRAVEKGS